MRAGRVYCNNNLAGMLIEDDERKFTFSYDSNYLRDATLPPIGIHFPKQTESFKSDFLFPLFYNMLSEGANKKLQSRILKIDEEDAFGFLLKTAAQETIGAIKVVKDGIE